MGSLHPGAVMHSQDTGWLRGDEAAPVTGTWHMVVEGGLHIMHESPIEPVAPRRLRHGETGAADAV